MKTNSISRIFAVIIMMIGFAMTTVAQTDIGAAANVVSAVSVTAGNDLQFGNVTPGNVKTIGVTDNVLQGTAAGTTETTGTWNIGKGANTQVTITLTLPSYLAATTDNSKHLALSYGNYSGNPIGAIGTVPWTPVTATPVQVTHAAYPTEFAASAFVVYVGGTVTPTALQFADSYTGTLTLTAVYN